MSEIRKEVTKDLWSIIAPARGARPFDFSEVSEEVDREKVEDCPFCPGNESKTPPEVYAIREGEETERGGPGWRIRVFPNKYPALDRDGTTSVIESDLFRTRGGFGFHEVIAETPSHHVNLAELEEEEIELVVRTYIDRSKALGEEEEIDYVSVFRNRGQRAGASLSHPHSQIMATSFVPSLLQREYEQAAGFFREKGNCLYCRMIEAERREKERLILDNDSFLVIAPFGSRFPYETHLLPKEHKPNFTASSKEEIAHLAGTLKRTLSALHEELGDFPYNYTIHTSPSGKLGDQEVLEGSYHWHLEVIPRLTQPAGFEWGSGNFINLVSPEDAAERLRQELS